jgi:hypothetical protein
MFKDDGNVLHFASPRGESSSSFDLRFALSIVIWGMVE